jgi:hypothetical protein
MTQTSPLLFPLPLTDITFYSFPLELSAHRSTISGLDDILTPGFYEYEMHDKVLQVQAHHVLCATPGMNQYMVH